MRIDWVRISEDEEENAVFVEAGDDVDEVIEEVRENGLNCFEEGEGDEEIEMLRVVFADDPKPHHIVEFTEEALRREMEQRQQQ